MSNQTAISKRSNSSMLRGERENSVFREKVEKKKVVVVKKEKLPKPKLQKRSEVERTELAFYGVLFLISLVSLGISFYLVQLTGTISSLLAAILSLYCLLFTSPNRWNEKRNALAFWNVSITLSILMKSTHFNLYQWRKVILYASTAGLALSYFISDSMTGVFGALFLLSGLFFLAERDFELYSKVAFLLAWISVPALIFSLISTKGISLGSVIVAMLIYQTYERVKDLEIEEPYYDE